MVIASALEIDMQLSDNQIDEIVNNTFEATDLNHDNKIDFEEYCLYCEKNPRILQPFCVDVSNLIQYEQESRRRHRYRESIANYRTLHHGPNKSPNAEKHFFGFGKMKKIAHVGGRDKIVRVRSIHDVAQICANDDDTKWADDNDNDKGKPSYQKKKICPCYINTKF